MTQEELAEKSGVSRQTIISIENDKTTDVKVSTLQKLASAMGTTVQEIFF
ncbi:MAG: helix-turn-helix transcriptional regulator [Oribacterium sp.]|nr:helix-turn-helix transcriptional regulator [Oribacterium sp.]